MSGRLGAARQAAPGLALAAAVGLAALGLGAVLPEAVPGVLLAVVAGLAVGNLVELGEPLAPGLEVAASGVLRVGVALLGARLSLGEVAAVGLRSVGVVVVCMAAAFVVVGALARLAGVPTRLAVLLGVGTAVCGNSAIVATAPVLDAEEREVGYAVATITLLGTVGLLALPLLGRALDLAEPVVGYWAGLAINDTSQVVAAGAAYGDQARDLATVVKLVRNALLAPVLLAVTWWWRRGRLAAGTARRGVRTAVPPFVLGFLALAALRTAGVVDGGLAAALAGVATACIAVAIAAVGLRTDVRRLLVVGWRPFAVGTGASAVLVGVAFGFARWLGA